MAVEAGSRERARAMGAFYTPPAIAEILTRWAVRGSAESVLDPSFGELAFLRAAGERLRGLGAGSSQISSQLHGAELDPEAAAAALSQKKTPLRASNLYRGSFFETRPGRELPLCEAVTGNPPYVRYQEFSKSPTAPRAHQIAREAGVPLSKLASSWAPFLIHSVSFVKPGGRTAQVLPAELLHAQYASELIGFLEARFERVVICVLTPRVFPGALEEVVLLLAEGRVSPGESGGATAELISCDELSGMEEQLRRPAPADLGRLSEGEKLLFRLLPPDAQKLYRSLSERGGVRRLGGMASVDIGAVTGDNKFFLLSERELREAGLSKKLLRPTVSKARHIQGAIFSSEDLSRLAEAGQPVRMLVAGKKTPEAQMKTAAAYLRGSSAERAKKRYKTRSRDPWWAVPLPRGGAPDLFLSYCSHTQPRLVANEARALNTNTVHGVYLRDSRRARSLAAAFPNTLTLLSAELEGRSYGGGVLKLEPTEAERLLIPPLPAGLGKSLAGINEKLRGSEPAAASSEADALVLKPLGLSAAEIETLKRARALLRGRREARGSAPE